MKSRWEEKSFPFLIGDQQVEASLSDFGITFENTDMIDEALSIGRVGNIVKRYKAIQDLKHGNKNFDLMLNFDMEAIRTILAEQCTEYDVPAQNATLTRENGVFNVIEGTDRKRR